MLITKKILKRIIREALDATDARYKTEILQQDVRLVHRSERPITLADCDAESPRISRQSRRGSLCLSGLYTYLEEETHPGIERYGEYTVGLVLPAGSKILDTTSVGGSTSRLYASDLDELRSMGYVAIKGRDFVGPPEWIVISNGVLRSQR